MLLKHCSSLVCPECEGDLSLEGQGVVNGRVEEGRFHCRECDRTYPIVDGIPVFLLDLERIKAHTARSFGYKWRRFGTIDEHYKKNFLDELYPLDPRTFFQGKTVLDAGTGMGIPSFCMAENGAAEVFAVDINESIRIARENNRRFENVVVAQGDIYKMPFRRNFFDVVVCVAVLQHLPDPPGAFDELLTFVKPGGTLVIWVYAREGNGFVRFFVEPFRKRVTRRLPLKWVLALSYLLGGIFQFTAMGIYKPLNRLNIRRLPLNDYIIYRTNFDYRMNTQMIFDQLLAPLSYLFTRKEVEAMIDKPQIATCTMRHHNRNSWTAICRKKADFADPEIPADPDPGNPE